jgi:hypothetical protein
MPRTIVIGVLLAAASVAQPLGAQAPTTSGAPGTGMDPRVSQALREKLSAGYDQRRDSSGIVQRVAPDRPLARQVPVVPESIPAFAQSQGARLCPMPVGKADPQAIARMPVARADSTRLEKMPVAKSGCVNPLSPP